MQTNLRSEKKKQQQRTAGTILGAHTSFPPLPYLFPIVVNHGHGKRKGKDATRPHGPRWRSGSAPPHASSAAARPRPRQLRWRRRRRGTALGQMHAGGGRRGRWSQPDEIRATIGGESLCRLTTTGTADQRDLPGILRGRCPRQISISQGRGGGGVFVMSFNLQYFGAIN